MAEHTRVWIVDDDEAIRFVLQRALQKDGYSVQAFSKVGDIAVALQSDSPDVIVTDIRLPDADGLSVLETLDQMDKEIPVIAITGFSDLDQAVSAFKQGVFDYIAKPFDLEQVLSVVARACAGNKAAHRGDAAGGSGRLIGESAAMQDVFRTIGRLSRTAISVLITGETGSGKEVVAGRCMNTARVLPARLSPLTPRRFPLICWSPSCLVMSGGRLPVLTRAEPGVSRKPQAGPCSWMKLETCHCPFRPACYGCWQRGITTG